MKANLFLFLIFPIFLNGCFSDCGYLPEKEYAESLNEEQLSRIYTEVSDLAKDVDGYKPLLSESLKYSDSEELSKMNFKILELNEGYARIVLGGCFDDKAVLALEGLDEENGSITLISGEHSYFEKKVLWKTSN